MDRTEKPSALKKIFSEMPFFAEMPITAELYWRIRQQFKLAKVERPWQKLKNKLPEVVAQVSAIRAAGPNPANKTVKPRRLAVFCGLRYWIEHGTLTSLALAGLGHEVTFTFVPFIKWQEAYKRFDQNLQNLRIKEILQPAASLVKIQSLLDVKPALDLPPDLVFTIEEISVRDVQYTLQVEDFDRSNPLYHLRVERNTEAALAAMAWLENDRPDVLITPNGSILEMGAIYAVARYLDIPVVTYEFGEQRDRIWLARDSEVMRQETGDLWSAYQGAPLTEPQWGQIRSLFSSRQGADLWKNFARLWQGQPAKGGEKVRKELKLDERPIVLLPANVIGDSLTLGRQVFSQTMTEWLQRTVQYFASRRDVQLLVRIHPGERYISGPSVADVLREELPDLAENPELSHIHLVAALDPINTYDLIEIADLGLAYTTTVGMEMAMSGVPVILAGQTHYRGKGFTLDPNSWESYHNQIDKALAGIDDIQLTRRQVELAWNYAYRFFFAYPLPFPWHLLDMWEKLEAWPLERVLSTEGLQEFGDTFRYLIGDRRDWAQAAEQIG